MNVNCGRVGTRVTTRVAGIPLLQVGTCTVLQSSLDGLQLVSTLASRGVGCTC